MTPRRTLRTLVEQKNGLVVPGVYDGVSARLVERAGFPAVYMTGYGTSASRLGLPDLGYAGLAEMADHARNLAAAVSIPLIADADTGYGNALSVRRTVRTYEAAGVAALHIEDQVAPKRCGHLSGHQIVPLGEFAGKIRAAVESRTDPDLLVIARTDAISAVGFDEALRRGEAAAKAGADVLFIEAPRDEAQVERVARELARRALAAAALPAAARAGLRRHPAADRHAPRRRARGGRVPPRPPRHRRRARAPGALLPVRRVQRAHRRRVADGAGGPLPGRMIRAVVFDLDGVLSDTERLHVRAEHALLAALGLPDADAVLDDTAGLADVDLFTRVFAAAGVAGDVPAAVAAKRRAMLAFPAREIVAMPGALTLVAAAAGRGLPLAVASSSPRPFIERVLAALGVADRFACVVSGDEVPCSKPAPDVFLLAARRLGVTPAECVVVEDSWNGMLAARAAGMRCVGLVASPDGRAWPADLVVSSLAELDVDRLTALAS
jgi:HAD superfamily hydrolase (TIGR01509 family)